MHGIKCLIVKDKALQIPMLFYTFFTLPFNEKTLKHLVAIFHGILEHVIKKIMFFHNKTSK